VACGQGGRTVLVAAEQSTRCPAEPTGARTKFSLVLRFRPRVEQLVPAHVRLEARSVLSLELSGNRAIAGAREAGKGNGMIPSEAWLGSDGTQKQRP
jgi:hypothetical protein